MGEAASLRDKSLGVEADLQVRTVQHAACFARALRGLLVYIVGIVVGRKKHTPTCPA